MALSNKNKFNEYLNQAVDKEKNGLSDSLKYKAFSQGQESPGVSINNADNITDFGTDITNDDYLSGWFNYDSQFDPNEVRAQRQSGATQLAFGVGRAITKAGTEIAKMPVILGGAAVAGVANLGDAFTEGDNVDFMKMAFDNDIIRGMNKANEDFNNYALPVYMKEAVEEGSFWDKISSSAWWGTEAADGVGYMFSMLAPGGAIARLGAGSRLLQNSSKARSLSKLMDKSQSAVAKAGKKMTDARNVDNFIGATFNTSFEAAAEAQGAMEGYEDHLEQLYSDGDITLEEYEKKLLDSSSLGAKVFAGNAAVLQLPNMIMNKMVWGKALGRTRNKTKSKNINFEDGQLVSDYGYKGSTKSITGKIGKFAHSKKEVGKDILKSSFREGIWEEGMQSTMEEFFSKRQLEEGYNEKGFGAELINAYLDMAQTTEGQTAMFLGSVLGSGMQIYQGSKARKKERQTTDALINQVNTMAEDINNMYAVDVYERYEEGENEGKIIYEKDEKTGESRPKYKYDKLLDKLKSTQSLENINNIQEAIEQSEIIGDKETLDYLRQQAMITMAMPFVSNENLGLDVLKKQLNSTAQFLKENSTVDYNVEESVKEAIDLAEFMSEKFETYQGHINPIQQVKPNENLSQEDAALLNNKLQSKYLNNSAQLKVLSNTLNKYQNNLDKINKEREESDSNKEDTRIETLNNKISNIKKQTKYHQDILDKFWDKNSSIFDDILEEHNNNKKEAEEIKKKQDAAQKVIDDIVNTKSLGDLNKIENINTHKHNPYIKDIYEKQKEALQNREKELKNQSKSEVENNRKEEEQSDVEKNNALNEFKVAYKAKDLWNPPQGFEEVVPKEAKDLKGPFLIEDYNYVVHPMTGQTFSSYKLYDKKTKKSFSVNEKDLENFLNKKISSSPSESKDDGVSDSISDNPTKLSNEPTKNVKQSGNTILLTKDFKTNEKNSSVSQKMIDFERAPRNKQGEKANVRFVSTDTSANNEFNKAVETFKKEGVTESNKEYLVDNLPMLIDFGDNANAYISTRTDKNTTLFDKTARQLRTNIVNALQAGIPLTDIQVEIDWQMPGQLQLDPNVDNKAAVNNVMDLYEFGGNIKNILQNTDKFFVVSNNGTQLMNHDGKKYTGNVKHIKGEGEVYVQITDNTGKPFPLKLNIQVLNDGQIDALYELYKYRFEERANEEETKGKGVLLEDLPEKSKKIIKESIPKELELLEKTESFDKLSIKDIVDFLIWDGSTSVRTRMRFNKKEGAADILQLFNKDFTKEDFDSVDGKEQFKHLIKSNNKRQNIRVVKKDHNPVFNFTNRDYVQYLIENKILNTNATVNEPTFQGNTSIYLNSNKIIANEVQYTKQKIEDLKKRNNKTTSSNQYIPVKDSDLKKGDVLYGLYSGTEEVANTYTVKALSIGGNVEQYLKGVLLEDNTTKKEKWWNSSDKFNWKGLYKKTTKVDKQKSNKSKNTVNKISNPPKQKKTTKKTLSNAIKNKAIKSSEFKEALSKGQYFNYKNNTKVVIDKNGIVYITTKDKNGKGDFKNINDRVLNELIEFQNSKIKESQEIKMILPEAQLPKINKNNTKNFWLDKNNSVSLQESKKQSKKTMEDNFIDNIKTKKEALQVYRSLKADKELFNKAKINGLTNVLKEKTNTIEAVKSILKGLSDLNISNEQLKKHCKF